MASQHFKVIPHKTLSDPAEIQAEIDRINEERMDYPFDIDGAVIKSDHLADRERLGSTAKFPKWAVAFKYPPEKKFSVVQDIVVQVGRTGVLTPKAVLSPVRLAGTTVTNATLHNQDFITEKDIRVGDTVLVQKAGEIIPEILSVDFDKRPEGTVPYTLPDACPVCGAPVVRDEDGAALRCTGAGVPGPAAAEPHPLRQPGRHGHRRLRSGGDPAADRLRADLQRRGPVQPPRRGRGQAGPDGGEVRGEPDPGH